jgi:hypothetical protein
MHIHRNFSGGLPLRTPLCVRAGIVRAVYTSRPRDTEAILRRVPSFASFPMLPKITQRNYASV